MFKYFYSCPQSDLMRDGKLIPERLGAAAEALRDCRLVTIHCTVNDVTAQCSLGPGTLIVPHPGDGSRPGGLGFEPTWTWLPFDSGREGVQALIGFDPAQPFDPAAIRRRRMIEGIELQGSDDSSTRWKAPIARSPALTYGYLATAWTPGADGQLQRVLDRKDQAIWELSGRVQDYLVWARSGEGERPEWADPWPAQTALQILSLNYRLGAPELAALFEMGVNPLNDMFVHHCLHAFVGFSEWKAWLEELQKKTSPDTSPPPEPSKSGSGEPAASPAASVAAN